MRLSGLTVLSTNEMDMVYGAALVILGDTGVLLHSEKVLDMVSRKGAVADKHTGIVKFPGHVVEACLKSAPKTLDLYSRERDSRITLGDGTVHFASGHNAVFIGEPGGNIREGLKKDVEVFALLADASDVVDINAVPVSAGDVPQRSYSLHAVEALFNNSRKHVMFASDDVNETRAVIKIAEAVCGGALAEAPIITCQVSPSSPLTWQKGTAEALAEAVLSGVPVTIWTSPMGGASAPYTLAAQVIQYFAEVLSGIVLTQLIREGAPVIAAGGCGNTLDMRSCMVSLASAETSVLRVAGAQLLKKFGLLSHIKGFDCDSYIYDEQTGMEKMITAAAGAFAGADIVVNIGMYGAGLVAGFEQFVIDCEMARILKMMMDGISFGEGRMAAGLIKNAGHSASYMDSEHTCEYLRSGERHLSALLNRSSYDAWARSGAPDLIASATPIVKSILEKHEPPRLDGYRRKEISKIIKDYENRGSADV